MNDRVILGSGITIAAIGSVNSAISGEFNGRVLVGSLVMTLLLSALSAAGMAEIARGIALLALAGILLTDGVKVIQAVSNL